jgi:hypothetical protein
MTRATLPFAGPLVGARRHRIRVPSDSPES